MTQPFDTDHPEDSTLVFRVYKPVGSANVSASPSTVRTVTFPSPVPVLPGTNNAGASGLFASLQGTSITTGNAASVKVSQGSFSSTPVEFTRFLSYEYDEHYLVPADTWEFTLAADQVSDGDRQALVTGARVEVVIDDNVQSIGYVDDIRIHGNRHAGSVIRVTGRDWMSPAVDSHVDPQTRFSEGMTLDQLLQAVFAPFGMQVLETSNLANRNAMTGGNFGTPTSKKGKPLKSYVLHQIKPYPQEGAFAFASRVAQRFGLWLRPAVDGKTIVCAVPDFNQPAQYELRLKTDGTQRNNVIEWDTTFSRADQPSILFASGFGGGGDFAHTTLRGAIINPLVVLPNPDIVGQLMATYPGLVGTVPPMPALISAAQSLMVEPFARPLYLYDSESKDPAQLRTYLQRELSLRMRKALTCKYTVEGHKIGGQPIAVDTMADVNDDISGIQGPMWIMNRRFSKSSREDGTKTTVELIRPGTLLLGPGTN